MDIFITANLKFGVSIQEASTEFQKNVVNMIEDMTAFNVNSLDLEVRDIIW